MSTVGVDEGVIRRYVRHQEERERETERHRRSYDLFDEAGDP